MDLRKLIITSNGARNEIFDDEKNCSEYRFKQKAIRNKLILFDGKSLDNVTLSGRGNLFLSSKSLSIGKFSLCLSTNTDIENITPRPSSSLKFNLNHLNLEKFNRISVNIYIESSGYENFYVHFTFGNDDSLTNHAPSIIPNQWNYITWECSNIKRDDVNTLSITPFLMGCPPEALPKISVFIDSITAELVDEEYDNGWELNERIAYCHSGYLPISKKIAITGISNSSDFIITNIDNGKSSKYKIKEIENNLGKFYVLDFSRVIEDGTYTITIDTRTTKPFKIGFDSYDSSIWKSLNFLRLLRCGEDIPGVHSPCHLNCKTVHPNGNTVPNFGGWHDAGDVSQFEICTAEMANAICDLASSLKSDSFIHTRLLEEAKVGLMWLLRTRFGDGYRTMGVTYSIWRKNILENNNTGIYTSKAEAGAFENFLSSSALACGSKLFKDVDKTFAEWCKRAAIEDFDFACYEYDNDIYTTRWGKTIESQTSGSACLAASELFTLTNDKKYLDIGYKFAKIVLDCQEIGTENIPLKGFFYEDRNHNYILAYEHRGHEQSPVQGLTRLYQVSPNENNYDKESLKKGLDLYRSYIVDTMEYTKPYNLLPGHIYHIDKINIDHYTISPKIDKNEALNILLKQVKQGINLGNGWFLRIMPIAITRRGFHATLLSKTKGVSIMAKTFMDNDLKNIALSQLEWILGKNPFASSTMYGEGYNYHPLYVAFSRQMVGALPVGIKTKGDEDKPYWPTITNAVYKEIWGHTTGKYLWVLADLL